MKKFLLLIIAMLFIVPAFALPPDVNAKFVKILAASAQSSGVVACKDAAVAAELEKLGVRIDASAKVAWAASAGEVKALKAAGGKLVICGDLNQLPLGGSIAIVEEGGKPAIYLHMGNIGASGATLSDAVFKIGKRL